MRRLTYTTPELVPLEYPLAGPVERGLAWLFDEVMLLLAIALVGCLVGLAVTFLGGLAFFPGFGFMLVFWFVSKLVYRVWFEWRRRGQTWGKRVLGIRTIQSDGTPLHFWQAFVRNIARFVDGLPLLGALGATMITFDRRGRRLGDFLAGSVVIREVKHEPPKAARALADEQNSLLLDGSAARRIRARVGAREGAILAEFVATIPRIDIARRLVLATRLASHYRSELRLDAHAGLPDEAVLRGVVGVLARDRFGTPSAARR